LALAISNASLEIFDAPAAFSTFKDGVAIGIIGETTDVTCCAVRIQCTLLDGVSAADFDFVSVEIDFFALPFSTGTICIRFAGQGASFGIGMAHFRTTIAWCCCRRITCLTKRFSGGVIFDTNQSITEETTGLVGRFVLAIDACLTGFGWDIGYSFFDLWAAFFRDWLSAVDTTIGGCPFGGRFFWLFTSLGKLKSWWHQYATFCHAFLATRTITIGLATCHGCILTGIIQAYFPIRTIRIVIAFFFAAMHQRRCHQKKTESNQTTHQACSNIHGHPHYLFRSTIASFAKAKRARL
jgi:hypothetical protein